MTADDLIVGFRRNGTQNGDDSADSKNLYVPVYPSWQQPRKEERGLRVELLVVVAVVSLVLIIVVVSTIYNWTRHRCCKSKPRDFNFSMSMYDDDSDPGVVIRELVKEESKEGDNKVL